VPVVAGNVVARTDKEYQILGLAISVRLNSRRKQVSKPLGSGVAPCVLATIVSPRFNGKDPGQSSLRGTTKIGVIVVVEADGAIVGTRSVSVIDGAVVGTIPDSAVVGALVIAVPARVGVVVEDAVEVGRKVGARVSGSTIVGDSVGATLFDGELEGKALSTCSPVGGRVDISSDGFDGGIVSRGAVGIRLGLSVASKVGGEEGKGEKLSGEAVIVGSCEEETADGCRVRSTLLTAKVNVSSLAAGNPKIVLWTRIRLTPSLGDIHSAWQSLSSV